MGPTKLDTIEVIIGMVFDEFKYHIKEETTIEDFAHNFAQGFMKGLHDWYEDNDRYPPDWLVGTGKRHG